MRGGAIKLAAVFRRGGAFNGNALPVFLLLALASCILVDDQPIIWGAGLNKGSVLKAIIFFAMVVTSNGRKKVFVGKSC